ncbi:response regulator [Laceyella putida]|uniref:Response regulator n=1 Tax=Laceyella putida TaxID=110101 RepID=A0ABW2RJE7_9BACL
MYTILIVDDEGVERQALNMIISKHLPDVQVIGEAENGRQAIDLARQCKPDVILLDIKMPGIDGVEAVKQIKQALPHTKFIMVSAFDTFEYARQVMQQGVKEYLLKPARTEEIVQAIRRTLTDLSQEREAQAEQMRLREQLEQALSFEQAKTLFELIKWGDVEGALTHFDRYFEDFVRTVGENEQKLKQTITDLFSLVSYMLKECHLDGDIEITWRPSQSFAEIKQQTRAELTRLVERVTNRRALHAHDLLHKAKQYMDEHYTRPLSLEEVAAHVRLSPHYFSKLFKERFQMNFMDYLTGLRIEQAKQLLLHSDCSLKEICFSVGYKDPNYFSRVFKKITGVSPSEYRRGLLPQNG